MRRKIPSDTNDREQADSAAAWMISFSDLLTVLLAMFVMRFSMSTFDPEMLRKVLPGKAADAAPAVSKSEELVETLKSLLSPQQTHIDPLHRSPDDSAIAIEQIAGGALISLGTDTFRPGSRELSPGVIEKIVQLGLVLENSSAQLEIAGHSDDIPISTPLYPSNWELSTARAISVAEVFMRAGIAGDRISAVGYADTKPKADNSTPEGRQRNRRVEIFITKFGDGP